MAPPGQPSASHQIRQLSPGQETGQRWSGRVNSSTVRRYIEEGIEGLLRDKTRPSRIPPLSDAVKLAVLTKTATEEPADATHWSRASMAEAIDISP